jgi:tetratricopeptide (TPR) repeat protein
VELEPENVNDHRTLANLLVRNDQVDEAIVELERVLELDPNDQQSQETLSSLYRSSGDEMGYVRALEKSYELDSENTDTMLKLAKAYYDQNENAKAVEVFEKLLEKTPDDAYAMEYYGGALQNLRRYRDALRVYEKIMSLRPEHKKVLCEMAICYKELGQLSTARRHARRASDIDAQYGYPFIVVGEVYEASVEACMNQRGERTAKFDDKLVLWFAYKEYEKAQRDLEWREYAKRRIDYLKTQIPSEDDIFFHKEAWEAKKTELECYNWIR